MQMSVSYMYIKHPPVIDGRGHQKYEIAAAYVIAVNLCNCCYRLGKCMATLDKAFCHCFNSRRCETC